MIKKYRLLFCFIIGVVGLGFSFTAMSHPQVVNCNFHSLQTEIDRAKPGDTIIVKGTCNEEIFIAKNDLTLIGSGPNGNAVITGHSENSPVLITILSAVRIIIDGFDILLEDAGEESTAVGILADAGASLTLKNSDISGLSKGILLKYNSNLKVEKSTIRNSGSIGLDVQSSSTVEIIDDLAITDTHAFGLEIIDGSELMLNANALLTLTGNFFGAQVSGGSTVFTDTGSKINADNNILIGFSINTGAAMIMFNSDLSANGNGLDGLDIVSSASLDIDGNSTLTVNSNRREGLSIDNGSLNIFGFFSTIPGLPKIIANNNTKNGIQVEFGGKLDIGRNSSLEVKDNGLAGISFDDGSTANIHDSIITGNNGMLPVETGSESDDMEEAETADIVLTFGSRVSFRGNNNIGAVLCDDSSFVRGDVMCEK